MEKEFEIAREFEVAATPEQYWDAVTNGTAGWLWPMEYEPREGGAAGMGGTVAAWDPPRRLVGQNLDPDGRIVNQVAHTIEPREGGRGAWVRYVHSGIFVDDWDNQYDGAGKHTDFYLHTLQQYLAHFQGRPAAFADVQGPEAATAGDAFERACRALGLPGDIAEGARVRLPVPGIEADAVVDYRSEHFAGLRTDDAMYRIFGRNAWGAPVAVTVHEFDADTPGAPARGEKAWRSWLDDLYAS